MSKNGLTQLLMQDLTALGSMLFYIVVLLFTLVVDKMLFVQLLFGLILVLVIVVIIRSVYFKDRPKKQKYKNFLQRLDASSFPSIHAARSACLAVLLISYFHLLSATIFFSVIALLVSYSRYSLQKHYAVDIICGFVLGMTAGIVVCVLI